MASMASTTWNMSSLKSSLPSIPSPSIPYYRRPVSLSFPSSSSLSSSSYLKISPPQKNPTTLNTFTGLSPLQQLLIVGSQGFANHEYGITVISTGSRFYCMRHGRKVPKLNRPPDQRKALLRGLTTQLLKHGRIKTTRARASAMRKYVDKMITLAKDGSLHKRRQALGFIYEKQIVSALFAEVPERYGERNGGYTRIIRTLPRRGDNAPMAYIELV